MSSHSPPNHKKVWILFRGIPEADQNSKTEYQTILGPGLNYPQRAVRHLPYDLTSTFWYQGREEIYRSLILWNSVQVSTCARHQDIPDTDAASLMLDPHPSDLTTSRLV